MGFENNNSGVSEAPGIAASTGLSDGEGTATAASLDDALAGIQTTLDDKSTSDDASVNTDQGQQLKEENNQDDINELLQGTDADTSLVKRLRSALKRKVDVASVGQSTAGSEPDPISQRNNELVSQLFEFDVATGRPTTKNFVENLAKQNVLVASDAFSNLSSVPLQNSEFNNWTVGHEWLKNVVGIDPLRIDEFRAISRGEIQSPVSSGKVPDFVPAEYAEAYKSLSPVLQSDIDLYLDGSDPDRKAAAMQQLQDRSARLANERATEAAREQSAREFSSKVEENVSTSLETTYTGLLDSVKSSDVYANVKVSQSPVVDSAMKESILSQIVALGDANPLLSSRAVSNLSNLGVQVDRERVGNILGSIEQAIRVEQQARLAQERTGQDYSAHIAQANFLKSKAVTEGVTLANRYFNEALRVVAGQPLPSTTGEAPPTPVPPITGGPVGNTQPNGANKSMSPSELDSFIMNTANTIRGGA